MRKSIERSTFPHCPCLPSPPRTNAACYQAKAHEINQVGVAEAAAILAKGDAEAKVRTPALSCFAYFPIPFGPFYPRHGLQSVASNAFTLCWVQH